MDNRLAGVLREGRPRQQRHDVFALDECPRGVEQEAAVEVPVEGHAEVGASLGHRARRGGAHFREEGVGHAVGEGGVRVAPHCDRVNLRPSGL